MLVIDGIRYRPEDAKRLGLVADTKKAERKDTDEPDAAVTHKARRPAKHGGTHGARTSRRSG